MTVLRYLLAEISRPLLLIGALLLAVFVGYSAARLLGESVEGVLAPGIVLELVLLKAAIALEVLLPVALYLSVVLGLGRLYRDSEMAALRACGLGSGWVYRAVLIVALPLSVVVAGLSLYGRPLAYTQSYWLKARAQAAFELDNLRAGSFYETREGGGIVFAQAVDHESGVMHGVFVKSEHGQRVRVTYAREARYRVEAGSGERVLALADARVTELGRSEDGGQVVLRTPELVIRLPAAEVVPPGYKRKAATTASLLGSPRPADAAELQWRLSTPVSTALLALLGVPLGQVHPRQGKYGKLLLAVALYAVYFNLTGVARTWVEQGAVGAVPGIWWVPALLALVLAGAVLREPLQRLRRSR